MIAIVIVSHSKQLAQGVQELATQMVQGKVPLVVAAGIDDPENPLGTDAMQVYEAIASSYSDEGVIVLMDLGSAVINAEMALEFLPEELRDKVHLCEAPLVEGAIAAAVAAASGSDIQQVIAEARGALVAKATQLGVAHNLTPFSVTREPSLHHFLQGIPASNGVAIAPVFLYRPTPIEIQQYHVNDIEAEWQRLQVAIQTAHEEIQAVFSQASIQIGDAEAAIFDAHLLFLEDPVVLKAVQNRIFEQHYNAEVAWQGVVDELANNYHTLEDSYLQKQVVDIVDVGQRVLRLLTRFQSPIRISDHSHINFNLFEPVILIAADLSPFDIARLDPAKILGICTTSGTPLSHSAIIARRLGIPAIVGLPPEILEVAYNTRLALDGESGKVWIEPEPDIQTALEAKRNAQQVAYQQALVTALSPAMTRDQKQLNVFANIGSLSDTQAALSLGAEGVGLFRTELLYLERTTSPAEEEQLAVYQSIAQLLDHRPLIIRTLDVGGDKPIPYLNLPQENNPFLGWRGIRFCLDHPDIFKTQLRAILKASPGHQIKIMFPMIATVQEIQAAKAILAEVQAELRHAGIPFDENMEVGMMVETPSAVVLADKLAAEVDFFSLGTNDLSQYVMAADRTHPRVATLVDALHPAVLRMIQQTVQAAHQAGIWVGLCGELAADPLAAPILLGLGLDQVSLNPQAIPGFKQAIAQLTMA